MGRCALSDEPELWSGEILDEAPEGSLVIGQRRVRLRNRFTPNEVAMVSVSNDNQTFAFRVAVPLQHEGALKATTST